MRTLVELIEELPSLHALAPGHRALIAGCASNRVFSPGEALIREGEPADLFFILREGTVAIQTTVTGRGPVTLETLHGGELLGWSWLVPPFTYRFDARSQGVTHALAFDAACLRGKCDADPALGYDLLKVIAGAIAERTRDARLRLLDVYGTVGA
jgi:CRP/FNR family cyclic AMP-dependent transcriptional regulator